MLTGLLIFFGLVFLFILTRLSVKISFNKVEKEKKTIEPRWEAVLDSDGEMIRVRWSEPGPNGEHLYVRHYPSTNWGINAAQGEAKEFNKLGRSPYEWPMFKGR